MRWGFYIFHDLARHESTAQETLNVFRACNLFDWHFWYNLNNCPSNFHIVHFYYFCGFQDAHMLHSIKMCMQYANFEDIAKPHPPAFSCICIYVKHLDDIVRLFPDGFQYNISCGAPFLCLSATVRLWRSPVCFNILLYQWSFILISFILALNLFKIIQYIHLARPLDWGMYSHKIVRSMPTFLSIVLIPMNSLVFPVLFVPTLWNWDLALHWNEIYAPFLYFCSSRLIVEWADGQPWSLLRSIFMSRLFGLLSIHRCRHARSLCICA